MTHEAELRSGVSSSCQASEPDRPEPRSPPWDTATEGAQAVARNMLSEPHFRRYTAVAGVEVEHCHASCKPEPPGDCRSRALVVFWYRDEVPTVDCRFLRLRVSGRWTGVAIVFLARGTLFVALLGLPVVLEGIAVLEGACRVVVILLLVIVRRNDLQRHPGRYKQNSYSNTNMNK